MKVMVVSFSFRRGGAGLAALAFARLATEFADVHCISAERSKMDKISVNVPSTIESSTHYVKRATSLLLSKLMYDGNSVKHSLNLFSASNVLSALRQIDAETIVNLHWINNDTLDIWELGRLPMGTVVTLHDEWFFRGTEHSQELVREDTETADYEDSISGGSVIGFNWNRYVWRVKRQQIGNRNDLIFTAPSHWLLERAKRSEILRDKDVRLIRNPIDTDCFRPLDQSERVASRAKIGIEREDFALSFGAMGGQRDPLKGFALLREALEKLRSMVEPSLIARVRLVTFGGSIKGLAETPYRVIEVGRIDSRAGMRRIYASSDCVVVPSLVESFGQVAAESLACGTPVVAFRTSGLKDIVQHGVTGYLAEPYCSESLAASLARVLRMPLGERGNLGEAGRDHVEKCFSPPNVRSTYQATLEDALQARTRRTKAGT